VEVDSQVVAVATASTDVIFKEVAHGFLLKYLSISKQPETPNQRSFLSWGMSIVGRKHAFTASVSNQGSGDRERQVSSKPDV